MGIAIDPEDLRKKYVKKMEFWGGKAVATDIESMKVIPPYCEANSFLAEGAKSENNQLLMSDLIFEHTGDRGIHAIDRVGIEGFFTRDILGKEAEAICDSVRGSGVNTPGETKGCCDLAKVLPTPYETALIVYEEGTEKKRKVHDNAVVVKLPFYSHKLYQVVVKGFGVESMMLLTSCPVKKYHMTIWRIVGYYLARRKCNESYRYIKQCHHLEDV